MMMPLGPQILELEVGIIQDSHELCLAWSPKYGIVRPNEAHHLEGEFLCPEVALVAERDGSAICPSGIAHQLG